MKTLTVRLPDDAAEYLAVLAPASHLSANQTIAALLRIARDNGWTEISMVPTVRRPDGE